MNMFPNIQGIVGGVFPTLYPEWFKRLEWEEFIDTLYQISREKKVTKNGEET
jgi:hypothetical protein